MKKITVLIVFIFALFSSNQSIAQLDVANWPNTDWSITGSFTTIGFTNDPRLTPNFTYDDDISGSGSLFDDISAESPIIDLNPAVDAGELQIQVTLEYIYRRNGDSLTLEYWNPDNGTWNLWEEFLQTSTSDFDYKNCSPFTAFASVPLPISTFTATQLLGFKYRLRYNDNGWSFGVCFGSPTLSSIETPDCFAVTALMIDEDLVTNAEAVVDWTDINVVEPTNGWEIEYGETGFTQGSSDGTIVAAAIHPYTISGLDPNTTYDVYVRALCNSTDISEWTGPSVFTTAGGGGANDECGGQYVDSGGSSGQYSNGEDITTTICPDESGEVVTVNFLSFETENCCDNLTIYDGPNASSPNLGTFQGDDLPPTFTSTDATGCLTFVFHSDGSIVENGWVANIICGPPPTCFAVSDIDISTITDEGGTITWTDNNDDPEPLNGWQVEIVPSGSTPTGVGVTATSPYVVSGLDDQTEYDVYVRAICDDGGSSDPSFWIAASFQTLQSPPECGESYVDSGGINGDYSNNEDQTFILFPDVAGDFVTLQFLEFETEACCDDLTIYDGPSTASPVLGVFAGNNLPPILTSSDATGALTVVFDSDGSITESGWLANVFCGPTPTCFTVTDVIFSNLEATSADVTWTDNNTPAPVGGWDVEYGYAGYDQGVDFLDVDTNVTNPHTIIDLVPSTFYDVYIRSNCALDDSDSSFWVGPINFRTEDAPPPNDTIATAIPLVVGVDCEEGVILGNNILATSSVDFESEIIPNCADPLVNSDVQDIWFSFQIPETTTVTVELSSVGGGMIDPVIAAYTGTSGNLVEILCRDDNTVSPDPENATFTSFQLSNYTPGETIYVRVWSYPDYTSAGNFFENVPGAFRICVFGQARGNGGQLGAEDVIDNESQITYYPNPVNDVLTVNSDKEISNISIYTILGQEVIRKSYTNEVNVTINLQSLSAGTYFGKALIEGKIQTFKIIKK